MYITAALSRCPSELAWQRNWGILFGE